jgi:hypothetical protein
MTTRAKTFSRSMPNRELNELIVEAYDVDCVLNPPYATSLDAVLPLAGKRHFVLQDLPGGRYSAQIQRASGEWDEAISDTPARVFAFCLLVGHGYTVEDSP